MLLRWCVTAASRSVVATRAVTSSKSSLAIRSLPQWAGVQNAFYTTQKMSPGLKASQRLGLACQSGDGDPREHFQDLKKFTISAVQYNQLLYLCKHRGDLDTAKMILDEMAKAGKLHNNNSTAYHLYMEMLVRAGQEDAAFAVLEDMKRDGITRSSRVYLGLVDAFCDLDKTEEVFTVLDMMAEDGVEPVGRNFPINILQLLERQGHSGKRFFEHITKEGIRLSEERMFDLEHLVENSKEFEDLEMKPATIASNGVCTNCLHELEQLSLSKEERDTLFTEVRRLLLRDTEFHESPAVRQFGMSDFEEWLALTRPFDVVIDGLNVGCRADGRFRGNFVMKAVELFEQQGLKAVVFVRNHVLADSRSGGYLEMRSLQNRGLLYALPNGSQDDLYWLFAAVSNEGRPTYLMSNDQMRDITVLLSQSDIIRKWRRLHQVHFYLWKVPGQEGLELGVRYPHTYVVKPQQVPGKDGWHFPAAAGRSEKEEVAWWCCTRKAGG